MIFKKLIITDFRAFSGEQTLDLAPKHAKGENRPIVLFGGLNGSGKTSTLMAIRVVIHGRQSLGQGTSSTQYHAFLKSCIHRNPKAVIKSHQSSISLSFDHAHMGEVSEYRVTRTWAVDSADQLSESLSLSKDGEYLDELNYEQCQSFLNEMIPPGVADLFLFDGEKIAELAEDSNGAALSGALKKLVGIDLLETLQTDLKATQRRSLKRSANEVTLTEINNLEKELDQTEEKMQTARMRIAEWESDLRRVANLKDNKNNEILSRGGAWAEGRDQELRKEVELRTNQDAQKANLRELLGSSLPFAYAPKFCAKVLKTIGGEIEAQQQIQFEKTFKSKKATLKKAMAKALDAKQYKAVEKILLDTYMSKVTRKIKALHNVSPLHMAQFSVVLADANRTKIKADKLAKGIDTLATQLEMAERNISRAPDEEILAKLKTALDDLLTQEVDLRTNLEMEKKSLKATTLHAINTTQSLKKLTNAMNTANADARLMKLCEKSVAVVSHFSKVVTARKLKQLETEFYASYQRLARKKTSIPRPVIDPKTFRVSLLSADSSEIDKNDMSAGEKQIYAIAMLNALGKITGKNLPIIIDTPLGRLDSQHRDNIVENYFPFASHQVIILSTDTEIHETYQSKLEDSISHSIKLEYSEATNSTIVSDGYFWAPNKTAVAL